MAQLILIPGLAAKAVMWQHQHEAHDTLDTPIPARVSDAHARHDTVEDMAGALLADYPGDLVLCGASMGGIVAMEVARQAPDRIRGLALLGTNAKPETDDVRKLREMAIGLFEAGRAAEVLRANVLLAFHASRAGDRQLVQIYLDFVLAAGADQLVRQNRAIMARPDARKHLACVRCPVSAPIFRASIRVA